MDYNGQHEWDKPLAAIIAIGGAVAILTGLAVCAYKSSKEEPKEEEK